MPWAGTLRRRRPPSPVSSAGWCWNQSAPKPPVSFFEKFRPTIAENSGKSRLDLSIARFYCRYPHRGVFGKLSTPFDEEGVSNGIGYETYGVARGGHRRSPGLNRRMRVRWTEQDGTERVGSDGR